MGLTNDKGEISLGGIVEFMRAAEDATSMSLFQYTKRSTIKSRVYIEQALSGEEILVPLLSNIMNLYSGLILTALDMNRFIQGSKKVRDIMSVVSTEDLKDPVFTDDKLASFFAGSNPAKMVKEVIDNYIDSGEESKTGGAGQGSKFLDFPKDANIPSGRIIEAKFGLPEGKGSMTVTLLLELLTRFIPEDVAAQFVGMNFTPSIKQRWMQVSTGEIAFFQDFVMGQDMRKRRMKAMKNDKTGALKDMVNKQQNSLADSWLKLTQVTPEKQNIANTILIFEKNTFDKACSRYGLNFKRHSDRQKFFNKSFAMMLCTVDPMYNQIDMYYHGLDATSSFTFDQMRKNAKTDATDLVSVMKMYAQGQSPKF